MRMAIPPTPAGAARRLLVINPNSNALVTEQIARAAARVLAPDTLIDVVNPKGTPHAIENRGHREAAEPAVIALIEAAAGSGYAGYVLACFDDIAIEATRGRVGVPVVCAVEASLTLARSFASRIGIVTTVDAAVPRICALVGRYGFADVCSVRAAGIGVAAAATLGGEAHGRITGAIERAVRQDGAEVVILGSGGLAGHGAALSEGAGVRIIDSIAAAVAFAAAAARLEPASQQPAAVRSLPSARPHRRGDHHGRQSDLQS
jgi:allantoin racemase